MTREIDPDGGEARQPSRLWLIAGALVAAAGFTAMSIAGSGKGVSETAEAREDSVPFVETATVEAAGNTYEVTAPGRLSARDTLSLVGEVSGKVTYVSPALRVGGRIKRGETILRIDDGDFRADLARAEAQLATATARLKQAEAEKSRQMRLADLGAAPEKAAEQAVATFEDAQAAVQQAEAQLVITRRTLNKAVITAPFDAIVTQEGVSPGTFVSPGQTLATLISAGAAEIKVGLPAEDISAVRAAMRAAGNNHLAVQAVPNSSSLGSKRLDGRVAEFSPVIDQSSRTATLIAVFPDAFTLENDGEVFTEDFMNIVITGVSEAPIWRIPEGAVRQDSFVWVIGEDEQAKRVDVQPIDRSNGAILVHSSGLNGGEDVMITVLAEEIEGMRVHVAETAS